MDDNSQIDVWLSKLSWIDKIAGIIWSELTILILLAFRLVILDEHGLGSSSILNIILIIVIWLYPVYTLGFSSLILGLVANILIMIFIIILILIIKNNSSIAALYISPVLIWLSVAIFYVILQKKAK